MRLLLLGATGAVGSAVLDLALSEARISRLIAPTRRPLGNTHVKLDNPVVDFTALDPGADYWRADAVICALGSTIKQAGSQAAFARIDRDLPISIGKLARARGASHFILNSSVGASARGSFYLRTKHEAERGVAALGYPCVTWVRPSLIDTARAQPRPAEQLAIWLCRLLNPLIPRQYRSVRPGQIAQAMLNSALAPRPGISIVESRDL
ncbi:hypothetical protein [Simiduia agarivorans]|uniref:Uncharacterized protein n=1 Tax=Simiduia agarivorans (strain DSM 21679 / JCM 13881 / BCRC 17597 / SA1) TaxID=1117647 RepID=K4KQ61_SIMAS|nr:hypothetical protein [Simiduia agarivorans]AFV00411.1 hypothetical protein M5M_16400 [Simiduia agarivorans SA1 = DSM 21679]